MKKILTLVLLLVAMQAKAQKALTNENVDSRWASVTLKQVKSGSLPDMLEAFHRQWPMSEVADVLGVIRQGLTEKVLDDNTGYGVSYSPKNGYVETYDDGADNSLMQACYWRRSDGHRLLAITIGQPVDMEEADIFFYDYDDAQHTLTPVTGLLKGLPLRKSGQRFYNLPNEGKNMSVNDYGVDGVFEHLFTWDDMKPVYSQTKHHDYDFNATEVDGEYNLPVSFKGNAPTISDFISARLAEGDLGEVMNALRYTWLCRQQGKALPAYTTLDVDTKNGYVRYERSYPEGKESTVVELCYWNCADGTHKVMAENIVSYQNGRRLMGQYDGITFHLYDNSQHAMKWVPIDQVCRGGFLDIANSESTIIALPRVGKNIRVDVSAASGKTMHWLQWMGNMFVYK